MEKRHIVTVNIFVVNTENPDETVNYLAERAEEIGKSALERAQREESEVEQASKDDDSSSSSSEDDESSESSDDEGWDTEQEALVCDAEQARKRMHELTTYAGEKLKAFLDAKEELEKAEREKKEGEEEFRQKSEYAVKRCEEIKQEKIAKKKRKIN